MNRVYFTVYCSVSVLLLFQSSVLIASERNAEEEKQLECEEEIEQTLMKTIELDVTYSAPT